MKRPQGKKQRAKELVSRGVPVDAIMERLGVSRKYVHLVRSEVKRNQGVKRDNHSIS